MGLVTKNPTTSAPGYQDGYFSSGTWLNNPDPIQTRPPTVSAAAWRIPSQNSGVLIGTPVRMVSATFSFRTNNTGVSVTEDDTARLYLITSLSTQAWATNNPPPSLANPNVYLAGSVTIPSGTTTFADFSIPMSGAVLGELNSLTMSTNWDEFFAFFLTMDSTTNVIPLEGGASFTQFWQWTHETALDTGRSNPHASSAVSRMDRCPVCGFVSLREGWVLDQTRGRRVCPMCWDEPDPPRRILPPETPPVGED